MHAEPAPWRCEDCGLNIYVKGEAELSRSGRTYCYHCYTVREIGKRFAQKGRGVKAGCLWCEKPFLQFPKQGRVSRFCSLSCESKYGHWKRKAHSAIQNQPTDLSTIMAKYANANARTTMGAELYSAKTTPQPGAYTFTKFDNDLKPLKSYLVTNGECNCPRGESGKRCRHQDMIHTFTKARHVNDGWLFNYATRQWISPPAFIAEAMEEREATSHDSVAPQDPPPEPVVLASAPTAPVVNGGGSALRRRKL